MVVCLNKPRCKRFIFVNKEVGTRCKRAPEGEKALTVHAYVYMSSHIHLIVTAFDGELQNVVRDFKKYTSKKLIEAIKEHPESRRETQRSGSAKPMAITEI